MIIKYKLRPCSEDCGHTALYINGQMVAMIATEELLQEFRDTDNDTLQLFKAYFRITGKTTMEAIEEQNDTDITI